MTIDDLINALPDSLRKYIHDIETRCDPAGETAARVLAEDTAKALMTRVEELENREASCCPEDVGCDEYIATLKNRIEELRGLIKAVDSFDIGEDIRAHASKNTYKQWIKVVSDE
jgi:hypothetical protein